VDRVRERGDEEEGRGGGGDTGNKKGRLKVIKKGKERTISRSGEETRRQDVRDIVLENP
jgi:hypothetical protein